MKILTKMAYAPIILIYALGPLLHDVLPNFSVLGNKMWGVVAIIYFIGLVLIVPPILLVRYLEHRTIQIRKNIALRLISAIALFSVPYFVFWNDWAMFNISLIITMYISFVCMLIGRKDVQNKTALLKDKDSGNYYRLNGGKAHLLSEHDVQRYKSGLAGTGISSYEFSSSAITGFDSNATENHLSFDSGMFGNDNFSSGMSINPSSGSPMVGGISGHDISGNSWGTNFNEPTNTYDPNRGY